MSLAALEQLPKTNNIKHYKPSVCGAFFIKNLNLLVYYNIFLYLCSMKKVADAKPGDKIIYKSGSKVVEATVVEKPIDDKVRPKFLIGRVDLDNGDYLTRGSYVYESVDECKQTIIQELKEGLEDAKMKRDFHNARVIVIEARLKELEADESWAENKA